MGTALSILDLAPIRPGETATESFASSVTLARLAERLGYRRVWYAEHHNMSTIASSATSVLIAHVAANTESIRLGAGGIMLPNHSPLVIAEQFGTLEALHPGRIDLGLGRAPGSDQTTAAALRRNLNAADRFPDDVLELQGYLTGHSLIPGVQATPRAETIVPLYILGSSTFGAQLAAALGLPYAFASHFAPDALLAAISAYRDGFRPSSQLDAPYLIVGLNVFAADSRMEAEAQVLAAQRRRVATLFARGEELSDEQANDLLNSAAGRHVRQMMRCSAIGTLEDVREYTDDFARQTGADELMTVHHAMGSAARLHSVELLAETLDHSLAR
jgi:luciferase family oxidoreductase group 1